MFLGKGETMQEGDKNRTNLANALEAIIGAIYVDGGIDSVKMFILENIFTKNFQF